MQAISFSRPKSPRRDPAPAQTDNPTAADIQGRQAKTVPIPTSSPPDRVANPPRAMTAIRRFVFSRLLALGRVSRSVEFIELSAVPGQSPRGEARAPVFVLVSRGRRAASTRASTTAAAASALAGGGSGSVTSAIRNGLSDPQARWRPGYDPCKLASLRLGQRLRLQMNKKPSARDRRTALAAGLSSARGPAVRRHPPARAPPPLWRAPAAWRCSGTPSAGRWLMVMKTPR